MSSSRIQSALLILGGALSAAATYAAYRYLDLGPLTFQLAGESWRLMDPRGLSVVALVPLLFVAALRSLSDLPRVQRLLGASMRALLLIVLGLAVCQPAVVEQSTRISTVLLVDVSDSVSDAGLTEAQRHVDRAFASRGEHHLELVTFAQRARRVPRGNDAQPPRITRHDDGGDGSNLTAALRLSLGLFEPDHLRRVVVLSDGLSTHGQAHAEAARMRAHGVRIFGLPLRAGPPAEVGVHALHLPERVRVGAPFVVRPELFATRPGRVKVRLYQGGTLNALDGVRELVVQPGRTRLEMRSVVHLPGPITYRVEVEPEEDDRFETNNRYSETVEVPGPPRVLLVDSEPARADHFARALSAGGFDVDLRDPRGIPSRPSELRGFDFYVLSDVPHDALPRGAAAAIERYIRGGGGFLMAGGNEGFGLGGYRGTDMERLLPVRMDARQRKDQPSLAMALVIDKSGSMEGRKIQLAKEAARVTAELLGAEDYIGVIGFDARPQRIVRMQSAKNRLGVSRDIGRLSASGGTAIFPALDAAYADLSATRARIKHVILLTDGQTQESGIELLVQNMRADGITVSTIGLGADVNRGLLSDLARLGAGRSYFTAQPHNIPRLFVKETHEVARSSAVEDYVRVHAVRGAALLRGVPLSSAPMLRGYVATRAKPAPAQVILASELGEPLLARWRLGLGWALAWTSDLKSRWAAQWLTWHGFSRFWNQLVREHMRPRPEADLPLSATLDGDEVQVVVDALDNDDRFINGLEGQVAVRGPLGGDSNAAQPQRWPLPQRAPGRYEARLALSGFGTFLLEADLHGEADHRVRASGRVTRPFPAEYASFEPAPERLEALARAGAGILLSDGLVPVFDAEGEHTERLQRRWSWCIWAALFIFLLDLGLRRVRWFDGRGRSDISAAHRTLFW